MRGMPSQALRAGQTRSQAEARQRSAHVRKLQKTLGCHAKRLVTEPSENTSAVLANTPRSQLLASSAKLALQTSLRQSIDASILLAVRSAAVRAPAQLSVRVAAAFQSAWPVTPP